MFDTEVAKVGVGVDPETMEIEKYELENLILWDTPGLGDGREADNRHAKNIIHKLNEVDANGKALIDIVLVILDGGTRDLGTSYELINKVIIPNLGEEKEKRLLVAINQADMAMKGRNWDDEENKPNQILVDFLEEEVHSVKTRIYEATGVKVEPIYYCAGYKEEGSEQVRPYNLSKLLYYIVKSTTLKKRLIYTDNINREKELWKDNDELINYSKETRKNILESIIDVLSDALYVGEKILSAVGGVADEICNAVGDFFGSIFGF